MAKKTTTTRMKSLAPKHQKAATPKEKVEARRKRIITESVAAGAALDAAATPIESVTVTMAAEPVPQPVAMTLGVGKSAHFRGYPQYVGEVTDTKQELVKLRYPTGKSRWFKAANLIAVEV